MMATRDVCHRNQLRGWNGVDLPGENVPNQDVLQSVGLSGHDVIGRVCLFSQSRRADAIRTVK